MFIASDRALDRGTRTLLSFQQSLKFGGGSNTYGMRLRGCCQVILAVVLGCDPERERPALDVVNNGRYEGATAARRASSRGIE